MFLIQSESDLRNAFRPRERDQVAVPPELRFPLLVRGCRSWVDPAGFRTFLVLEEPQSKRPLGIVFQRDHGGAPVSAMCDWCHSPGSSMDIGLLTTEVSSKRRVGVNVCLDLRCAEKVEEAANLAGKSALDLHDQLVARMVRFAHEGLGIDYVPVS
jgi:hypothetical protein